MKIEQSLRHWAAKRALTAPVIGSIVNDRLVDLHVRVFSEKADPAATPGLDEETVDSAHDDGEDGSETVEAEVGAGAEGSGDR